MAAPSGGGGGQEGGDKNTYYILWVIALIGAVAAIIWYFAKVPLKEFFIALRVYELVAINFVLNIIPDNVPWIGSFIQQSQVEVASDLSVARTLTPAILTADIAQVLSEDTGKYLRYPFALYFLFLVYIIYKTNVHVRLKKKYNMRTLAAQEQQNWPQIKIATKIDLLEQDLDVGPWAMTMSPMQYAKRNRLITVDYAENVHSKFSKAQGPEFKASLDRVRTQRAFAAQLGRTWQGIEAMAPHRRAIFAIFIARGNRDTKTAQALVAQLAASAAEGRLDCAGADALWRKHQKSKPVQEMCQRHAYEFTVFISALQFAREDGVLPSSDFLWVKPIDRRLWYVINNVGRQTPATEVGAIFCHWYSEMALKRPLSVPSVDGAIIALELSLSETIYIPDDKEREEINKRREAKLEVNQEVKNESA